MDKHKKKSQKYAFSDSEEQLLARQLDYAKNHPEMAPAAKAPPDEFQKIMAELEKKGVTRRIQQELLSGVSEKCERRARLKKIIMIGAVASVIVATTAVGVSAKKAYNFRVKYVDEGGQKVRINNDDRALTEISDLEKAYQTIADELGIKVMKVADIPADLVFERLDIKGQRAKIVFSYNGNEFYFVQGVKQEVGVSKGIDRDNKSYKTVENKTLKLFIEMNKNELATGGTEYSSIFDYNGNYYIVQGVIEEKVFKRIIEGLRL